MPSKFCAVLAIVTALTFSVAGCTSPQQRISNISRKIITDNEASDFNLNNLIADAEELRQKDCTPKKLMTYTDSTIARLYDAISTATFYLPEKTSLVDMQRDILNEKIRRNKHTTTDLVSMLMAYLGNRSLNKAADFRLQFPGRNLPFVPDITPLEDTSLPHKWRVYEIANGGNKARLINLPLELGPHIVMVMFTGCSVGEKAMTDILADSVAGPIFREYGLVISDKFDSQGIAMWQDYFKFTRVYITRSKADFEGFEFSSSPHFYFILNGKVMADYNGWEHDIKDTDFINKLPSIGLATSKRTSNMEIK